MSVKNKEVLITDDDSDLRNLVRKILDNVGMIASKVQSVGEAFEIAKSKVLTPLLLI